MSFSNESVANSNYEALQSLDIPIAQINTKHNVPSAANLSSDDMSGLDPNILICEGAKVMSTLNLWVEKGLCYGSI